MTAYLLRRLLQGIAIAFVVVTFTFLLIHAAPGDPFARLLDDPRMTPELQAALRARYGLDRPLAVQYVRFLANLVRGDLGTSLAFQRPVSQLLAAAIPNTLLLMTTALVLSFTGGIALGAAQGAKAGGWFDRLTGGATVVISAIPDFWLALGAVLVFALRLHLLPSSGMRDIMHQAFSPAGKVLDLLKHLVLPAGTLALVVGAAVARYQRAALIEALPGDFVRTARAKGVPRRAVLYRHALRNALLPTITLFGLAFPALLGGAVFVENIFGWPGMGGLAVNAIFEHDYPIILAVVLAVSVMVVLGGLLADLLYAAVDPRLRRA
jgi:peptide/nickel transport system permease protein